MLDPLVVAVLVVLAVSLRHLELLAAVVVELILTIARQPYDLVAVVDMAVVAVAAFRAALVLAVLVVAVAGLLVLAVLEAAVTLMEIQVVSLAVAVASLVALVQEIQLQTNQAVVVVLT
jgi:hypothetical protein